MRRFLFFLIALVLSVGTLASAGPLNTIEDVPVASCKNMQEAITSIQTYSEVDSNPLTLMLPKADCWLLRTKEEIVTLKIDTILPIVVVPLALAGFVISVIGAAASGVPRRVVETAIQGMVGAVLITASLPDRYGNQGDIPRMIVTTWTGTYVFMSNKTGPTINARIGQAGDALSYVISYSPLALIGFEAVGGVKAIAGGSKFFKAWKNSSGEIQKLTKANDTLRNQLAKEADELNDTLATLKDPAQKTAWEVKIQNNAKKLEELNASETAELGKLQTNKATVTSQAAREAAEDYQKKVSGNTDKLKGTIQWAMLAVLPILLAYSGAVYGSGLIALMMALTSPMLGVAVIFGRGGIILKWISSMLSNLLIIATLPVGFIIAVDIGFVQPLIAMKGMFAMFRDSLKDSGTALVNTMADVYSMNPIPGIVNPFAIDDVIRSSISLVSTLATTLGLLITASLIGLVLMLGSLGMAVAVLRMLPATIARFMDSAFDNLSGSGSSLGAGVQMVTSAVFKDGKQKGNNGGNREVSREQPKNIPA